jgi:hypothetical protein
MNTQADVIIELFGGVNAMSRILGHKHPTTVSGWKKRGYIPAQQQDLVLEVGRKNKIPVMPEHFFRPSSRKRN